MAFRVFFVVALCSIATHLNTVSCMRLSRIVGGQSTSIEDFPYMVSLHMLGNGGWKACGGSIITPMCVLTAAHCLVGMDNVTVRAGSDMMFSGGETINADQLFIHKEYNQRATFDLDVAIIRVAEPLEGRNMEAIQIDYSDLYSKETVSISGWGDMMPQYYSSFPDILQTVNLTIVSSSFCSQLVPMYNPTLSITENMFCTYNRDKDSCGGDSGGPVVRNGKQVGIVSFGAGCAFLGGVYTRIGSLGVSSFIQRTIRDNC